MAGLSDSAGVVFTIKADSSNAQANIKKFNEELKAINKAEKDAGSGLQRLAREAGLTAEQYKSLAGDLTLVSGGLAIIAGVAVAQIAVAVKLTSSLFDLAKRTAEYGSAIFDATQKTGLSARSLSALQFAADTSGSSLEAISGSVAKFSKLLGDASNGNEKAIATLNQYGITAKDTDAALEQAIGTIAKMTDSTKQSAAAAALFKDRTGEILPVIKSFDGDLPGLMSKLEKLGLIMSESDAQAADEFGDTLDTLTKQAEATGRQFAFEFMPSVTHAMRGASTSMQNNESVARIWGQEVAKVLDGAVAAFKFASSSIGSAMDLIGFKFLDAAEKSRLAAKLMLFALNPILGLLGQLGGKTPLIGGVGGQFNPGGGDITIPGGGKGGGRSRGGGGGKAGASDEERLAKEELQNQLTLQRGFLQQYEQEYKQTLERIRNEFKKTGDDNALVKAADDALTKFRLSTQVANDLITKLEVDIAGTDVTETKRQVLEQQAKKRLDDFNTFMVNEVDKTNGLIVDSDLRATEQRIKIEENLVRQLIDINQKRQDAFLKNEENVWDELIADQQGFWQEQNKLRGEATTYLIGLFERERDRQIKTFEDERNRREKEINDTVKDEERKLELIKALNELFHQQALFSQEEFERQKKEIEAKYAVPSTIPTQYDFGSIGDTWQQFKNSVLLDGPTIGNVFAEMGSMAVQAFGQIAGAIGNMVQAWVLFGSAGPNAMRKMVASVLAGVAAQSAVLAIFELAKGFAALFWNPVAAGMHFKAAALFGILAVGTAIGGRAVAGDAFNQGGAAGSAAGSGSGGDGNGNKPPLIEFTERFAGFQQGLQERQEAFFGKVTDRINTVLGGVEEQLSTFNETFGLATPGDVVMAGAGDASSSIRSAYESELSNDPGATSAFFRRTGLAT